MWPLSLKKRKKNNHPFGRDDPDIRRGRPRPYKSMQTLKTLLSAFLFLMGIYVLVPHVLPPLDDNSPWYRKLLPESGLSLGLDLQGGLYLEMDVDLKDAFQKHLDYLSGNIEKNLEDEKFAGLKIKKEDETLVVTLKKEDQDKFIEKLRTNYSGLFQYPPQEKTDENSSSLVFKLSDDYKNRFLDTTANQAIEAVRNRIDKYGVAEPSITRQGLNRLVVELPGLEDERIISIIQKTGQLEFRLVNKKISPDELFKKVKEYLEKNNLEKAVFTKDEVDGINAGLKATLPQDSEIIFEIKRDNLTKKPLTSIPFLVFKRVELTGNAIQDARVSTGQLGEPEVAFALDREGAKIFADLTEKNKGHQLAIVLDGNISSAPVIKNPITDGAGIITLGGLDRATQLKEAQDLVLVLKEGALPANLSLQAKTKIGPSLGADSIQKGLYSLLFAAAVIMVFMIAYYRGGGLIANLALIFNLLLIFAILALFKASLSLPGFAGIVLTMGMAVDANIIIFERMREEKRAGKTAKAIVESGYGNAMSAIIDSNLTTLISGVVLYQFGTGPIKGFATTLIIGIATTMFTGIIFTRIIYDWLIYGRKVKSLSI